MARKEDYRYSYSGADTKAYAAINGYPETLVHLESMHTVSVSVHESKGQARALGYRGVKGISRGVRTVAGSLIMTVIEDHPMAALMRQSSLYRNRGWSVDRDLNGVGTMFQEFRSDHMLSTLIEPFDLMLQYVSEGGALGETGNILAYQGAGLLISNIDIVDVGLVTSVNDIVTEMTFSFIAQDLKSLSLNELQSRIDGSPEPFAGNVQGIDIHGMHAELERYLFETIELPRREGDLNIQDIDTIPYDSEFDIKKSVSKDTDGVG